jgi:hypothetical protein
LNVKSVNQDIDTGHGRVEHRVCSVVDDLSMIEQKEEWKNLYISESDIRIFLTFLHPET